MEIQISSNKTGNPSELRLLIDIRSLDRGGQLIARAGTVVNFVSDEGEYIVASTKDGQIAFPLDPAEYEVVADGDPKEADIEESIYMSRGKGKRK